MKLDPDLITKYCFDFYKSTIPNKIKPDKTEWTTLSGIVLIKENNHLESISCKIFMLRLVF